MKYRLLKELPFLKSGVVFERICNDREDCCIFVESFHNCVKHHDTIKFSDDENKTLCSIIDDPDWVVIVGGRKIPDDYTAEEAIDMYDSGKCSREDLVQYIRDY